MKKLMLMAAAIPFASVGQTWVNADAPATVVELYTSEGCSSCPPAEATLNALERSADLWNKVIPLAFHVDYWNYIGWDDTFADAAYSQRQRDKVNQGQSSGVYTPGWFINDQEWRGFFARQAIPYANGPRAPTLTATLANKTLRLDYEGTQTLVANIALVAMNQTTEVKRGENRGRTLDHDFIVVDFAKKAGKNHWEYTLPSSLDISADAIAIWLTPPQGGDPVQTVAGWLDNPYPN
nr:DUF1223 domain-containing protein [Enterovibrio norvegicus]